MVQVGVGVQQIEYRPVALRRRPRSDLELAVAQLHGVDGLTRAWRAAETAAVQPTGSREARLDLRRELAVRRRMRDAVIDRTQQQLHASGGVSRGTAAVTAVLVLGRRWFATRLAERLEQGGCRVVAQLEHGADAVGFAAAEQPDLVLIEDRVVMLTGERAVQEFRRWCPDALVAVQVTYRAAAAGLLQAGAAMVFTRQAPPAQVAEHLLQLVQPMPETRRPPGPGGAQRE